MEKPTIIGMGALWVPELFPFFIWGKGGRVPFHPLWKWVIARGQSVRLQQAFAIQLTSLSVIPSFVMGSCQRMFSFRTHCVNLFKIIILILLPERGVRACIQPVPGMKQKIK